jgi:hypothetical protein
MAELNEYQRKIQDLLIELANYVTSDGQVESQLIFDPDRNHYQLVHVGWRNKRRIYDCVVHLDIKDGKIWVQHNGTEFDVGGLCNVSPDYPTGTLREQSEAVPKRSQKSSNWISLIPNK